MSSSVARQLVHQWISQVLLQAVRQAEAHVALLTLQAVLQVVLLTLQVALLTLQVVLQVALLTLRVALQVVLQVALLTLQVVLLATQLQEPRSLEQELQGRSVEQLREEVEKEQEN